MAVVPSIGVRVTLAKSLCCDLVMVIEWFDLLGMKLNESKAETLIVSRSCSIHPQSPSLTIGGAMPKESDDLFMLGVTFDS